MYVYPNFDSKKKLKEAVAAGHEVTVFQPGGLFPDPPPNWTGPVEGPHYPKPHKWYAQVVVKNGKVVSVK